ncbi:alpha/beta-type small acid-soluble spore protein [Oceanobacillus sp. J11TS1]|uniref:alpha/beta-type small acid-soluble spore protein n=1 Tax=Oceanobacillus sp. J11TS1 TaxID=2807191 RepID=UPI001B2DBCA4|nr:alpha/beta-type small acid-soluble spore protein [Oceanobacillus sp. J11TS1]GIO24483.1 acid-soluble spore protein [Oceanobacillus sp. J11TS1]
MADKRRNALLVPQAERALNQMKEEIAGEMHVNLGADTTARENGAVGGEMVKRMIQMAEGSMKNQKK